MAEDLVPVLAKFHRDILLPDVKRVVSEVVDASERRLRDEMQAGFDSLAGGLTPVVTVRAIGIKVRDRVLIGGEEADLG